MSEFSRLKSPKDYRREEAQLIMSLKFHQSKTLSELPLDVALNAMLKVWDSCQDESYRQSDSTIPWHSYET